MFAVCSTSALLYIRMGHKFCVNASTNMIAETLHQQPRRIARTGSESEARVAG